VEFTALGAVCEPHLEIGIIAHFTRVKKHGLQGAVERSLCPAKGAKTVAWRDLSVASSAFDSFHSDGLYLNDTRKRNGSAYNYLGITSLWRRIGLRSI
jgi:hypothetical protein